MNQSGRTHFSDAIQQLVDRDAERSVRPSKKLLSDPDPESCWLILAGTARLLARMKSDQPGTWEPLLLCETGQVLLGVSSGSDLEFQVEWSDDAEYIVERLDELGPDELAEIVAEGLAQLTSHFSDQSAPLIRADPSDPERPQVIESGRTVLLGAPQGMIWLVDAPVRARLDMSAQVSPTEVSSDTYSMGVLPGHCVISVDQKTSVRAIAPAQLVDRLPSGTSPTACLGAFIDHLAHQAIVSTDRKHRDAYWEKISFEREVLREAIGSFTTVAKRGLSPGIERSRSELVNAAREVMEADGLTTPKEFTVPEGITSEEEVLRSITEQSGCFYRFIEAPVKWHRRHAGPMLAIWGSERIPVVLQRGKISGYRARYVDQDGSEVERKVDSALARELSPCLVAFYPSFPDHPLTGRDLWLLVKDKVLWNLSVVLILGFIGSMLQLFVPFATGYVVGTTIPDNNIESLLLICIGLTLALLTSISFYMVAMFSLIRIEGILSVRVTAALVTRIARLPLQFFEQHSAGDLVQRLVSIEHLRWAMSKAVAHSLVAGLFTLMYLFAIAYFSTTLLWASLVVLSVYIGYYLVNAYISVRYYKSRMDMTGNAYGLNILGLESIETIRLNGSESQFLSRYLKYFAGQQRAVYKIGYLSNLNSSAEVGMPVLSMAVFYLMYFAFLRDELSVGAFLGFFAAFSALLVGMIALGRSLFPLFSAAAVYHRIKPILQAVPESTIGLKDPGRIHGHVVVRDLIYSAPGGGRPIIDGLDLEIFPNQVNVLVGPSGCGKTTLVRLFLRILKEDSGTITFDGAEAATLDPRSLRRHLGVVGQQQSISPASIRQLISPSGLHSDDEIWNLLGEVGLKDDFKDFNMGLATTLGPSSLSGGQQQRLAIGAALGKSPHLLLLDQSLSSLETNSQRLLIKAMRTRDITLLLITQRLSALRTVEHINYMDQGRILESGSFTDLLNLDGGFASMAREQLTQEDLSELGVTR